jgi:hypothetical protein
MPNWCNNNITLEHEDPAMIKRAFDALERGEFLNEFIPVPQELKETVSGFHGDADEQAKLEAQTRANIDKFGYGNWYDYCVGEWGTKWDTGEQGCSDIRPDGLMLHAAFDTAWSPPLAAYEKMLDLGFKINAMYYESGMCYAGVWEDGIDDYYDLSDMNSVSVSGTIPSELDEAFAIVETMEEYEAENEEELTQWIREGVAEKNKPTKLSAED